MKYASILTDSKQLKSLLLVVVVIIIVIIIVAVVVIVVVDSTNLPLKIGLNCVRNS